MSGDAEQMRAASDSTITIAAVKDDGTIEQIECKRLRPADLAEATDFIYTRRTARHMQAAVKTELALETVRDMHARSLSMIQCGNVSVYDVVCDPMGRIKLCQLAMSRAGTRWTFEQVKDRLAHVDLDEFFFKLCELSGCYKLTDKADAKEGSPDPLGTAVPTPTETPSAGTTGTAE